MPLLGMVSVVTILWLPSFNLNSLGCNRLMLGLRIESLYPRSKVCFEYWCFAYGALRFFSTLIAFFVSDNLTAPWTQARLITLSINRVDFWALPISLLNWRVEILLRAVSKWQPLVFFGNLYANRYASRQLRSYPRATRGYRSVWLFQSFNGFVFCLLPLLKSPSFPIKKVGNSDFSTKPAIYPSLPI